MLVQLTINSLIGSSAMHDCECIGYTQKGAPCRNRIALENALKASAYTEAASLLHYSTREGRIDLQWLAGLLLCTRDHKKHSYEVMKTWRRQARKCLAADNTARTADEEGKQIPGSKNMSSLDKADPDLRRRDVSDDNERAERVKINLQTRSVTARARASRTCPVKVDLDSQPTDVSDGREWRGKSTANVQTRSTTARATHICPQKAGSTPEFVGLGISNRHLSVIDIEVMKHILNVRKPNGRLSEDDLKPGEIYAFTRPSSPGYVKIGRTKRPVAKRLEEWERQCKYSPQKETPKDGRETPYVAQIERLILAELSPHRRRESICNGGLGCHAKHHEWVEVKVDLALEVINRWCSWAEKRPYDEHGVLRKEWEAHTKFPVRGASRNEREQGNRWQEWIDSFPSSALLSSRNELPPSAATVPASNSPKAKKEPKVTKLGWSPSEIKTTVQSLVSKPRITPILGVRPSAAIDSGRSSRSVALAAA